MIDVRGGTDRRKPRQAQLARVGWAMVAMLLAGAVGPTLLYAERPTKAHVARVRSVTDSANLTLVSADGNTLVERGRASGTLPGTVEVELTLGNRTATSSFTINAKGDTISGHGKGTLKRGKGGYDSFGGTVVVVRGTGRFRGAHGTGGLYGSIYRVTDAMRVQVTGTLRY